MTRPNHRPSSREPDAQEQAALSWLARVDRGLSPGEEAEFERWLAADRRHARLFADFDGTWALLDRMQDLPATAGRLTTAPPLATPSRRSRGRLPFAAVAAAVALLLGGLTWIVSRPPVDDPDRPAAFAVSAETLLGERRIVSLPDGSRVHLNTDSAVDVHFDAAARALRLRRGEAHFVVAHDPARPFTVVAAGIAVRAVGTAFNVRVRADTIDVLVTAGRVAVQEPAAPALSPAAGASPPPPSHTLAAGQSLAVPREDRPAAAIPARQPIAHTPGEIERVLAWQEHRLEFEAAPLAEMVAEFNRYNRHQLVIDDPDLAAQRFGGSFRPDDPAGFVRVLEANFRVNAETRGDVTHLRLQR